MTQRKNVNKHEREKNVHYPELLGVKFQHQLILSDNKNGDISLYYIHI